MNILKWKFGNSAKWSLFSDPITIIKHIFRFQHISFLGNRRTTYLRSLYLHEFNVRLICIKQKLLSSFWSPFCSEPSRALHRVCTQSVESLPTHTRRCGQFCTDILAHLRFKRVVSCWYLRWPRELVNSISHLECDVSILDTIRRSRTRFLHLECDLPVPMSRTQFTDLDCDSKVLDSILMSWMRYADLGRDWSIPYTIQKSHTRFAC